MSEPDLPEPVCLVCRAAWFRSMHGRKPLCKSHWWEWRRRFRAREARRYPEIGPATVRVEVKRQEQLEMFA
jgi:hypothetical protein